MDKSPIYKEVVYKEQPDGKFVWLGRVYNRVGPARVLDTYDGPASSRADAVVAAKKWSEKVLKAGDRFDLSAHESDRETVVLTADDVETVTLEDLGLQE